ncbi:hypothetical protein [Bacillus sp. P14.5]|uniref:hypothetical protein n=1 Tax=Bacillus sp. P14.5 TaxID=1983400 RepID=UPI000DE9E399|nr:hypothetical protein [Bacillus sp. P14.5]
MALLATSGAVSEDSNEWSEDDRLKLSEAVMKNLLSHVRPDRINTLLGDADTNADFETIIGELAATQLNAMRTISIEEQVKSVWIDETYYLQFKEGSESWLKSELLRFD